MGRKPSVYLPRKFNIAIGGRDNSVHAEINDLAFIPAYKGAGQGNSGSPLGIRHREQFERQFGFNVIVGGFFSAKRCDAAIPLNAWVESRMRRV